MLDLPPVNSEPPLPQTGIEILDVQHAEMLAEITKLQEANQAGRGAEVLEEVFVFLADYTATHFAFEEFVMQGAYYPGLETHRQSHQAFTLRFGELSRRFQIAARGGEDVAHLSVLTAEWLRAWLVGHIKGEDTAMAQFLRKAKPTR